MIDARVGPATVGAMEVSSMLTGYTRVRGRLEALGVASVKGSGLRGISLVEFRPMLLAIAN